MGEDTDQAGVYGFQKRLPRTFSSISNPKVTRRASDSAELYYEQRSNIANRIRQATPSPSQASQAQSSQKTMPGSARTMRKPAKSNSNVRGTNLSTTSTESGASMNSLAFSESEAETDSVDSYGMPTNNLAQRKVKFSQKRADSRRPSLTNRVGTTDFEFEMSDDEGDGKGNRLSHRYSKATMGTALNDDIQMELNGENDILGETLIKFHLVTPQESENLSSSYQNLMSGRLSPIDYEDTESEAEADDEDENVSVPNVAEIAALRKQVGGKLPPNEGTIAQEPLGNHQGSSKRNKLVVSRKGKLGEVVKDNDYSQDLSPEMIRTSLRKVKGKDGADLGNRKVKIKAIKSGRGKNSIRAKKRKSSIMGAGPGKCVIS